MMWVSRTSEVCVGGGEGELKPGLVSSVSLSSTVWAVSSCGVQGEGTTVTQEKTADSPTGDFPGAGNSPLWQTMLG